MNTFKFVGKIKKIEDKKDRKFIDTVTFESGWMVEKVKFRMVCGEGSEFIDLSGGKYQDDTKNTVYTLFKKEGADSPTAVEKAEVEWKHRFDPNIVEKVPRYKRYTVDLSADKIREDLKQAHKTEEAEALAALKYSYISAYDFTLKVEELLKLGKFGDDNYVVTGNVEYNYANKNDAGVYYRSFVPTNIYKATEDDVPGCYGRLDLYYTRDTVVEEPLENGDVPISGYAQFYDRMSKENFYAPVALRIENSHDKKPGFIHLFKNLGDHEAETLCLGLLVEYYSGAEKTDITEEDFTDDQRELIKWGLKTPEEIIKELGGSAFGERVNYIYIKDMARGYTNGPQNPDVEASALYRKPDGKKKDVKKPTSAPIKIDLFADDDEDAI